MTEGFSAFQTATWLIYGDTKAGKSTLLSTAPTPGLILDQESKWHFFQGRANPNRGGEPFRLKFWDPVEAPPKNDGTWDFAIVKVTDAKTLENALRWIDRNDHPFVSVGQDSLTVTQEQDIDGIRKIDEDFRIQDWGTLRRHMLANISRIMARVSDPANPLRVYAATAHSMQKDGKHRPAMQGGIQGRMPYSFDCVAYAKKALVAQDGVIKDDSPSVFRLLVKTHPAYVTGSNFEDRFEKSNFDNPNLTQMMRTIFPAEAGKQTKG